MTSKVKENNSAVILLIRLWHHVDIRQRRRLVLVFVLMLIASFAEVLSIGAILPFIGALTQPAKIFESPFAQPFIEFLNLSKPQQLIFPLTISFIIAAAIAGLIRLILLWVTIRISFSVGSELSNKIYHRTLYQSYETHTARNSSELISGIWVKVSEVIFYVLMPVLNLISAGLIATALVVTLFIVIPGIALVVLGGLAIVYGALIKLSSRRLAKNSHLIARESTNIVKTLQEGLNGIRNVLIDGTQEYFCNTYRDTDQILRRAQGNNILLGQSPRYGIEAMGVIVMGAMAYVLSQREGGIGSAIPVLAALALALQRLLPTSQQAYGAWTTIRGGQQSLLDTLKLLDQPMGAQLNYQSIDPVILKEKIELNNVSFKYSGQSQWTLNNISLTILKGSRIGIIGPTGCGKSTLVDILLGLLKPTIGSLTIDGHTVVESEMRRWQSHVAHVSQSIFLSDSSIEENIAFGHSTDHIDHERVKQVAALAQISEVIETLPQKYQTKVGERGIQLSGGQKQRIGIARALYKRADVLVLDEATSSLDSKTEESLMNAICALGNNITIIIIAHRINTLKDCSEIYEFDINGNVRYIKVN